MAVSGRNATQIATLRAITLGFLTLGLVAACSGNQTIDDRSGAERQVESLLEENSPQDDLEQSTLSDLFLNVDDPDTLGAIVAAISAAAGQIKVVFVAHPRTVKMLREDLADLQ